MWLSKMDSPDKPGFDTQRGPVQVFGSSGMTKGVQPELLRCCSKKIMHATQDCLAPYVDHILHRDQFWAISIASGNVRLWDLRSCCTVLSHVTRGHPRGLLQSSGGRAAGVTV